MISKEDMMLAKKYIIRIIEVSNELGGWYTRGIGSYNVYIAVRLDGNNFSVKEDKDWVVISLELSTLNVRLTDLTYYSHGDECGHDPSKDSWIDSVREKYKDSIPVIRFNKYTREYHHYTYDSSRTFRASRCIKNENIDNINKVCNRYIHSPFYDYTRGYLQSTVEVIPAKQK